MDVAVGVGVLVGVTVVVQALTNTISRMTGMKILSLLILDRSSTVCFSASFEVGLS